MDSNTAGTMMMALRVNINGTSRDDLVRQRVEAANAIMVAIEALRAHHPHGRDYQTYSNDDVYKRDRGLWRTRLTRLKAVYDEIMAEADAIQSKVL